MKNTKILYYSNELDINKHDASKLWKLLKNIIGKQGGNYSEKTTFSIDNEIIDNSEKIANEFNNFFVLPLFLTQKKIIRLITFSKHLAHTEPIFKSLDILPLNSLYYHRIGLLMYTLSNGLLPEALNELCIKKNKIHHYPTRNCDKYHIKTSTDSFSNVSARIWTVITTNIDVNISFMQFKIVLKVYLHDNEVILKYTK